MRTEIKIAHILDRVKELTHGMSALEMESLRDEMIAWLLFNENIPEKSALHSTPENLKGLSEKEKELIRKLAAQTNALYRAGRQYDEEGD